MSKQEMYSLREVSEILGLAYQTIRNWNHKGLIKSVKINGAVRVSREEVERLKKGR